MVTWQFASWIARFAAYWALLDAFHIGGSVRNALLVLAVQVVASVFPFTPGGAGVQQALLLTIFAGSPDVAAFSVGQQIATAVLSSVLGFARAGADLPLPSFREVIARGREHRRRESMAGGLSAGDTLAVDLRAHLLPPQPPDPELPHLRPRAGRRAAPDRLARGRPRARSRARRLDRRAALGARPGSPGRAADRPRAPAG